jgi:hypothetical protein
VAAFLFGILSVSGSVGEYYFLYGPGGVGLFLQCLPFSLLSTLVGIVVGIIAVCRKRPLRLAGAVGLVFSLIALPVQLYYAGHVLLFLFFFAP